MNTWHLSRYWNRLAFLVMRLGRSMIWDQTGNNADLIDDIDHALEYPSELFTTTPRR